MFSFVLDIFWCYLEIFVGGCSYASSFADSSVIPQIGISRASCGIAGNHHQFRLETPHINTPPCCYCWIGVSSFIFLHNNWFPFVPEVNDISMIREQLSGLSVCLPKIERKEFWTPPPHGVVYFLINHN